ncbi:hypothetical protein OG689_31820 [Kitasatospora sp. NBC_00240]|uniref:hypothetical protein n=1 Tax=Kitasatospora sp. NBC_00240 TaxID=2903567 RepID=UPI00224F2D88|nr:hypothetical protein [Kitasatospora sp. NBC_00240]MCX5213805.1 hypothetical protein [Kitasatospora sp. NBC_00240]
MFSTPRYRTAVAGAALLAAGGGLVATPAGAVAHSPSDTPPISHAVRAGPAETQVNAFFEEYRLAMLGEIDDSPRAVRQKYLGAPLNLRLDTWAAHNGVDPVFRARSIPVSWSVREVGTSPGYATVRLGEHWGDGTDREVRYTVRLADRRITDLEDEPSR